MSNLDKNIVITPNVGSATDDPKIVFSGANTTSNAQNITMRAYPTANGTLSVEGSSGQLFSITNQLTGTIFSVNDISGIPSIQVQDTGQIQFAPYNGNVVIGANTSTTASNSNTTGGLVIYGGLGVSGNVNVSNTINILSLGTENRPLTIQGGQAGVVGARIGVSEALDFYTASAPYFFATGSGVRNSTQFVIAHTGSAVNYLQVNGGTAGNNPVIQAIGSDSSIGISYAVKNNGTHTFYGAGGANFAVFANYNGGSSTNYLTASGNTSGNTPTLTASSGNEANVSMALFGKGTGAILVNQTYSQSTVNVGSTLQVSGNIAANGAVVAQNLYVQGGSNWITWSANLQNWSVHSGDTTTTVTANTVVAAPDGTPTTWQLNNTGAQTEPSRGILNSINAPGPTGPWIVSVWLRAGSLSSARLCLAGSADDNHVANTLVTLTNSWQRFVISGVTGTPFSASTGARIKISTNAVAGSVLVWGPQLELGNPTSARNVASPYTPTLGNPIVVANNNVYVTGNVASANVIVSNIMAFANSNNIVSVYQTYNSSTNSLDVVFG
jgi:hypothetical protein